MSNPIIEVIKEVVEELSEEGRRELCLAIDPQAFANQDGSLWLETYILVGQNDRTRFQFASDIDALRYMILLVTRMGKRPDPCFWMVMPPELKDISELATLRAAKTPHDDGET